MPDFLEFEHYQILRNPDGSPAELGRGGMGITYKAFDTNLQCNVALKVIDFGLAKSAAREADSTGTLTLHGFAGTPYFASPEQLEHEQEDIRSDIYSLGVTLWYMLTGEPPFVGSVPSVIAQHLEKSPPFDRLVILPGSVVSVLRGMLEKDRDKRIQTPSQLRTELRACLEQLHTSAAAGASPLPESTDGGFETTTLGTIQSLGSVLRAGETLNAPGCSRRPPGSGTSNQGHRASSRTDTPGIQPVDASAVTSPPRRLRPVRRSFLIGGVLAGGLLLAGLGSIVWVCASCRLETSRSRFGRRGCTILRLL